MKIRVPLITLLLLIVNGCLAIALGWRLLEGSRRADLVATDAGDAEMAFSAMEGPNVTPLEAIQSRAIFHQSRSFYVPPPVQEVVQPPPDYRLAGSMSVPGKQSAVLIHSQTGARVRVSMGEKVEGWTVAAIESGSVTIKLGDRVAEITAASRKPGTGVTLVGARQSAVQPTAHDGVRVLGNSAGQRTRPQPVSDRSSNQPPRLYRPPTP